MQVIKAKTKNNKRTVLTIITLLAVIFAFIIYVAEVPMTNSYFTYQSDSYKYEISE